ncbi:MAG: inorganic phosphate transporter [Melioribacteraceae bacterium]|nr:inorganic phosphate transporter [Melioribacteraceae bacterium]
METYLFLVIILFILATSDLVVGVANDAVNFLNSSLGSKVAPRHIILIVASAGVLAGTFFSSGMMEVARSGFFNPEMFKLNEVMVIFLAVMFTDVLLLDLFNTFGLPTSTTVSLISSLFAGSIAVALLKLDAEGKSFSELGNYINSARALGIFTAIILSVFISFFVGSIVQYISRLIFTFDFESRLKRYGAIWASVALTSITYFIFVKGAKGASFIPTDVVKFVTENTGLFIGVNIVFWTVVLQLLLWFTNINILKPIVLAGTFSLALAFAANDLVNFIGVPLAGLSAFQTASISSDPGNMTMEALRDPVQTDTLILTISGFIMIGTLWFNKKARSVTKTEINLGRQFEGYEKFESSAFARSIVRASVNLGHSIKGIIPPTIYNRIQTRFDLTKIDYSKFDKKDRPAFDYIRAIVNLMVASSLISLGTAYKLPLSTTYVTFMVAMATSFADKSWGRESAVFRVNGVLTVIAGWFLTALLAFISTSILCTIMYFGGLPATLVIVGLAVFLIIRSNMKHRSLEKVSEKKDATSVVFEEKHALFESIAEDIKGYLDIIKKVYDDIYQSVINENRKKAKKAIKQTEELENHGDLIISKMLQGTYFIEEHSASEELNFGKAIISIKEIYTSMQNIAQNAFIHLDNNHSGLVKDQKDDFKELKNLLSAQLEIADTKLKKKDLSKLEDLNEKIDDIKKSIKKFNKKQDGQFKKSNSKVRADLLFLNLLFKTDNISDNVAEIINFNKEILKHKK